MKFYEVRQYTVFPHKDKRLDKKIQEFESLDSAEEFSIEYNTKKRINGITGLPVWHKKANGKLDYEYSHNGNDRYYVAEIQRV